MKLKKFGIALMALMLAAFMAFAFVACDDDPTPTPTPTPSGDAEITDGIFEESVSGSQPLYSFMHFYENGIFYKELYADPAWTFRGQNMGIGEWELVDTGTEYTVNGETKTSEQSVKITNYDWTGDAAYETQTLAYADGVIYGVYVRTASSGDIVSATLAQKTGTDADAIIEEEQPYEVERYEIEDRSNRYVSLRHNGQFQVAMDSPVGFGEGTWALGEDGVYTLTFSSDNSTATLTVGADGQTATFKKGDTTVSLVLPVEVTQVVRFYNDEVEAGGATMTVELIAYSDNSAILRNSYQDMAEGTWSQDTSGNYVFELGGDFGTVTSVTADGVTIVTIDMGTSITLTMENITLVGAFTGDTVITVGEGEQSADLNATVTVNFYSNNTCVALLTVSGLGVTDAEIDSGTYTVDLATGAYSFDFVTAGEVAADTSFDMDNLKVRVSFTYEAEVTISAMGQQVPVNLNVKVTYETDMTLPS